MRDVFLKSGERGVIVGHSGSGKTSGAVWQLAQTSLAPVIVFDTKGEPAFDALPREREGGEREEMLPVGSFSEFAALAYDELPEYVLVRPSVAELADPKALDRYLMHIYEHFRPALVYIDEAYQFHVGSNAGPGLIGLLTRGRSRGISTLVGMQRPAWVTRSVFTEAVRFYVYRLIDDEDVKRMAQFIPGFDALPRVEQHHFWYYDIRADRALRRDPVPLVKALPPMSAPAAPGRSWL